MSRINKNSPQCLPSDRQSLAEVSLPRIAHQMRAEAIQGQEDDPRSTRRASVRALALLGLAEISVLTQGLKSDDAAIRRYSAAVLGLLGPLALPAIVALIEALNDPVPNVRRTIVDSIQSIGASAKQALPALEAASQYDDDPHVRRAASRAVKAIAGGGNL
jgi:HEAT repeat protein